MSEKLVCACCGRDEAEASKQCHHCGDNWASHCSSLEGHDFGESGRDTHPLAFGKWIGFVVTGFVSGGGGATEGDPRDTIAEAWADASKLAADTVGEVYAGIRPAS